MRKLILATCTVIAALALAGRPADAAAPVRSAAGQETMYVTISGETHVTTYWSCTWTAYVSGGTAPYTFQWSEEGMVRNWALGEYWNGYAAIGGNVGLNVLVTDANGRSAWGHLVITSDNNAPFCRE